MAIDPRKLTAERRRTQGLGEGVVLERGALRFDAKLAGDKGKVDAGRVLLEALRAEDQYSFGGRVANGVDVSASLKGYYRTLDAACALLGRLPDRGEAVRSALDKVSLPDDLRGALERVLTGVNQTEQPGPLGAVSFVQDGNYNNYWARWQQGDLATVRIDDATLDQLCGPWSFGLHPQYLNYGGVDFKVGVARYAARARERGLNLQTNLDQFIPLLPDTPEARRVLTRLARAEGRDPRQVQFHGRPLEHAGAATPAARPAPRHGGPLGDDATFAADGNYNGFWNAMAAGDVRVARANDATVERWFQVWGFANTSVDNYLGSAAQALRPALLHFYARAKERGLPVTHNGNCLPSAIAQSTATQELVDAIRRYGRAFGEPVDDLVVGGKTVSAWPRRGNEKEAPYLAQSLPPSTPLGTKKLSAAEAHAAASEGRVEVLQLDDESLKAYVASYGLDLQALAAKKQDPDWIAGCVRLLDRAAHLDPATAVAGHVQALLQGALIQVVHTPAVLDQLAVLLARTRVSPDAIATPHGQTLRQDADYAQAAQRLEQRLQGTSAPIKRRRAVLEEGPLGEEGTHANHWNARDVRFCRLSDQAIQNELPGGGDINQWLGQVPHAEVFRLLARTAEILPDHGAKGRIQAYLQQPVPAQWVSAASIPWIERMARAGDVPLEQVRLTRPDGTAVPLLEHPDRAPPIPLLDAEAKLERELAVLLSKEHPAVREGAAIALCFDEDPLELAELIPRLLDASTRGALEPIDLRDAPPAHVRDLLESSLGHHPHPGARALLAALLFRAPAAELQRSFAGAGLYPAAAQALAQQVAGLGELSAADRAYALSGVLSEGRLDLSGLGLRLSLLGGKIDPKRLVPLLEGSSLSPAGQVSVVLGRAALLGDQDARAGALWAVADHLLRGGAVDPAEVRAELGEELLARLARGAEAELAAQAQRAAASPPETRAKETDRFVDLACRLELLGAPGQGVERALELLYQRDLERVAPLGELDVRLGGVAGREWMRPKERRQDELEIAGVRLQRSQRPDKDQAAVPTAPTPLVEAAPGNLRALAARWRTQAPLRLAGPGREDMTELPVHMARELGLPLRELALGPDSKPEEVEAFLRAAAEAGELAVLKSKSPLEPELARVINGFFDGPQGRRQNADPSFRAILDAPDDPPGQLACPRFQRVQLQALGVEQLAQGLLAAAPGLEEGLARAIAESHRAIKAWAQAYAAEAGMPELSFAHALRAARRVAHYTQGAVDPEPILGRELVEVYAAGLPRARQEEAKANLIGQGTAPAPDLSLGLERREGTLALGDAEVARGLEPYPYRDGVEPVLTAGTRRALYSLMKAVQMGERPALVGRPGSGRTTLAEILASELGRPLAVHQVRTVEQAQEVAAGAAAGQVLLISGLEDAPRAAWAALEKIEGALIITRLDEGATLPGHHTSILVDHLEDPAEQAQILTEQGLRLGVPAPVTAAALELHAWVQEAYAQGRLGAGLAAEERPRQDAGQVFDALSFVGELAANMPMGEAFVVAMETFYPALSEADAATLGAEIARLAR